MIGEFNNVYLLVGPNGSWRQWRGKIDAAFIEKYGKPNNSFRVMRFDEGGFEIMPWQGDDWIPIADVRVNGSIEPWIENCKWMMEEENQRFDRLLKGFPDA